VSATTVFVGVRRHHAGVGDDRAGVASTDTTVPATAASLDGGVAPGLHGAPGKPCQSCAAATPTVSGSAAANAIRARLIPVLLTRVMPLVSALSWV
jgi:hypothetical protein